MSLAKPQRSKTGKRDYVIVSPGDLQPFFRFTSGKESVYRCPWCLDRKPAKGAVTDARLTKLYIDPYKRVGWCVRCHLVVSFGEGYSLEYESKRFLDSLKPPKGNPRFSLKGWTQPATKSDKVMGVLADRKISYGPETVKQFNLRAANIEGTDLLIIPDVVDDREECACFHYQNLSPDWTGPKYVAAHLAPLFWLDLFPEDKHLVLVEGPFDAISVNLLGGVRSAPFMGSSMTKSQGQQLHEHCLGENSPDRITVAVDGDVPWKYVEDLAKTIKKIAEGVPIFMARLPGDKDPEDLVAEKIFSDFLEKAEGIARSSR